MSIKRLEITRKVLIRVIFFETFLVFVPLFTLPTQTIQDEFSTRDMPSIKVMYSDGRVAQPTACTKIYRVSLLYVLGWHYEGFKFINGYECYFDP